MTEFDEMLLLPEEAELAAMFKLFKAINRARTASK